MTAEGPAAEARAGLEELGLSKYEAAVFVALERLDRGTARDVAEVTDVPRSQVYGAAESLQERGLVDVQRTTPKQFRTVPLSEAEKTLRRQQERRRQRAFEYLEAVEPVGPPEETERQEDIWTVKGRAAITERIVSLASDATGLVVYGSEADAHDEAVREALLERAEAGVATVVVSRDEAVLERFEGTAVDAFRIPECLHRGEWPGGRMVVVDGETVLLSVGGDDDGAETAFWSRETEFARVLVGLVDGWFGDALSF